MQADKGRFVWPQSVGREHPLHGHGGVVGQSNFKTFDTFVVKRGTERDAGQGRDDPGSLEGGGGRSRLGEFHDATADPATGVVGMNEESADHRGFGGGLMPGIGRGFGAVVAVEGFALAPAAATDKAVVVHGGIAGVVADELAVRSEDCADGALDLGGGVVRGLESAGGERDQFFERGASAGGLRGNFT